LDPAPCCPKSLVSSVTESCESFESECVCPCGFRGGVGSGNVGKWAMRECTHCETLAGKPKTQLPEAEFHLKVEGCQHEILHLRSGRGEVTCMHRNYAANIANLDYDCFLHFTGSPKLFRGQTFC